MSTYHDNHFMLRRSDEVVHDLQVIGGENCVRIKRSGAMC